MIELVDLKMQSTSDMYAAQSAIGAWQLAPFEAAPFNSSDDQQVDEITSYCSRVRSRASAGSNTLFIIPQDYSRGPLQITKSCMDALATSIDASPMLKKMIEYFKRDTSDCYLGRAFLEFCPPATLDSSGIMNKAFEFCCLLPYIEENGQDFDHLPANSCYREVLQWSVRQQGFYSSYDPADPKTETTVLVYPADALWKSMKSKYKSSPVNVGVNEGWQSIPGVVFESLTENWATYIACLHKAVEQIKMDAGMTVYNQILVGETNNQSLRDGLDIRDRLETAHHVLGNTISILSQIQTAALKRETIWTHGRAETEKVTFAHRVESVVRQLEFERSQVQRIITRLKDATATIQGILNLRGTSNMEQMTARTIREAHTMRVIAVLTLCFLPPTFIAGFLDMGYINVASGGGQLLVDAEPGLLLYAAITIPVLLVVLGGYILWEWYSKRNLAVVRSPV